MAKPAPALDCCVTVCSPSLDEAEASDLAGKFAALADPVRLRVFNLIACSPDVCSCEMTDPLGKSQPTVSHHTKVLSDAGLIAGERRGRWVYWRAVPDALAGLRAALSE